MSIVISNVSRKYSRKGLQNYIVKLNSIDLVEVDHISEEGMPTLLRKCANALEDVCIDSKIQEHKLNLFREILKTL